MGTEIDPARIKHKNWSRKSKRQKGILNPWKWGYASRGRSRTSGVSVQLAADEARKMLSGGNGGQEG